MTPTMPLWLAAVAFVLMVLPWLEPFAPGPSAAAVPLMFAWFCSSIVLGLASWREPQLVAWAWLVAALVAALFGLLQYFGATEIAFGLANYTDPGTAYGNLRQRNQFASQLSIGTLAALYLAKQGLDRRWAALAIALLAVANAASTSRTGLVELLLIALVTLLWEDRGGPRTTRLSLTALAVYVLAAFLLPLALQTFTEYEAPGLFDRVSSSPGCSSRMVLWSNVLELIGERPLFGWGIAELDYAHYAHLYGGARFCDILDNAHNLPLHVAVELGVPIALLFVGGLAWWIWRHRPWRETDPVRQLAWGVLMVVGLHSLLEYPLWYGPFQLATLLSVLLLHGRGRAALAPMWRNTLRVVALGVLPLGLGYAGWDYHRISQLYLQPQERSPAYREQTLAKARASWIFARQVKFAELSITPLTRNNARDIHALALDMLHFSPEPKVIEATIDSAMVLHDEPTALWHMARYKAAFPKDYEEWLADNASLRRKRE
ncbi:MAG TPA: Wzy polymerase domain-containing protein [Ramlibacter sp.]|nr:Wzy polymerase domain-containing protein [Ramlibacter sp.]